MKETSNHLKLGLFVTAGTVLLILTLYLIGSKRNLFSSTIKVSAVFYNVSGLMAGNNVRYAGINVGTVDKVVIENDSTIQVYMMIEKKVKDHIKKNSTASIGTDGLMGNKLVNISPIPEPAPSIEEGDMLHAIRSVETEEMIRTLSVTNDNVLAITRDLRDFTSKINSSNGIVNILSDSVSSGNIRQAFVAFRDVAENLRKTTIDLNELTNDLKSGKGLVGTLLKDSSSANNLKKTVENLNKISDSLNIVATQLGTFSQSLNNPRGALHALTNDTTVSKDMKGTLSNLKQSSETLNEDLKALQRNFLFRKYFKEKAKKEKNEKK